MTNVPASTGFVHVGGYRLNVTTRAAGFAGMAALADITRDTIKLWVFCAGKIHEGVSVEQLPEGVPGMIVEEKYEVPLAAEPYCTVWGDVRQGQSLTVQSCVPLGFILDTWYAREAGISAALELYPVQQDTAQPEPPPQPTVTPPHQQQPAAPAQDGIMQADRAPAPNTLHYPDGQLVRFAINRVEAGTKNGSGAYALWSPVGKQYPCFWVYMDNEIQMKSVGERLNALGLSLQNSSADVNWTLIVKVANGKKKDGSPVQYMNPVRWEDEPRRPSNSSHGRIVMETPSDFDIPDGG